MTIHVFAGPTLGHSEVRQRLDGALVHGPVKHGDLLRLELDAGDIVLMIDGLFHQEPPVRHKEILEALANGVTVIGASSMGALRAAELHQYGMIGIGSVFEMYRDGVIEADDEVAVTHTPPPDWRVISEALVNIRHAVALCADSLIVSAEHAEGIIALAVTLPYALRSWPAIEAEAIGADDSLRGAIRAVREFLAPRPQAGNLKRQDALLAIEAVSQGTFAPTPGAQRRWQTADEWRTSHLARWAAQFRSPGPFAPRGSGLALFNYQQIYDADFPRRWEKYVLRRIVKSSGPGAHREHESLRAQALAVATRPRLGLELLREDSRTEWLTPAESALGGDDELMIRVLVRSSCKSPDFIRTPWDADGLLVDIECTERAVAEAFAINQRVAEIDFTRHVGNLRTDRLRAHLAVAWGLGPNVDEGRLTAESRDRGFSCADEAAEAARPFFLRNSAHTARLTDRMLVLSKENPANA
jgi:hypothetical protein